MKTLRKVFFYFILTIIVVFTALIASVFLYKDRIIRQFINEANKHLNTPVKIGKIEVSVFDDFPHLSIVLNEVYVEDSHDGLYPLLTAKKISFQLNPFEVWQGKYLIKGVEITDSETNLKINAKGENNYAVVKQTQSGGQGESIGFQLADVNLRNTTVRYLDLRQQQDFKFTSKKLSASINSRSDVYQIEADGQLTCEQLKIGKQNYLAQKAFDISSKLVYNDVEKNLVINKSSLTLKGSKFLVEGEYTWKNKNIIDINTTGTDTDIQTLLSLLPEDAAKNLAKYQSKGDVYFKSKLKGEISKAKSPTLSLDFGFSHATLYHPEYRTQIEDATLQGSFASADLGNPRQSVLVLKNVAGILNGEKFTGNFVMSNFVDPEVICDFKGKVDAPSLLGFYPIAQLKNVSGSLLIDIAFEGKIALLKNKATAQRVSTQGTVELENINLAYGKDNIQLENLKGSLQFSNNDLALSNVSGKLGNSDFLLNGFFKNIITFLLFENQPIGIETDLKANFIDLNQLFELSFGKGETKSDASDQYEFSISRNVNLNFNCNVRALQYKRFHARNVIGDLLVKNQMAVSRNLALKTMGGDIKLSGIVDAQNNKAIDVVSSFNVNAVNLDSVFYVFENFQQNFIENKHLKGKASADVNLEMTLNQNLRLFQETLIADISVVIKNGELNNFEPMKKLNRYLDDEGLSRLRFSDLKNDIHIENKTVYIPQMEIRSNVTDIKISGTHTFDQRIDYRLITPLKRKKIIEADARGAMEEDLQGQPRLFLKITGTTDDYKVAYDTEAVKKKIVNDLKREVQELKDAFKNKGKKKEKEIELENDDYFDWDN